MKVGMFINYFGPAFGGIEESVRLLRKKLEELGVEVFIITKTLVNKELDPSMESDDHIIVYKSNFRRSSKKFARQIHDLNLDILHLHTYNEIPLILNLKKLKDYKCLYTIHNCDYKWQFTNNPKYYELFRSTDKDAAKKLEEFETPYAKKFKMGSYYRNFRKVNDYLISVGTMTDSMVVHYGINAPSRKIPTAIDLQKYQNADPKIVKEIKDKYNLYDTFVLVTHSKLIWSKRQKYVIDSLKDLKDKNFKLLVVGGLSLWTKESYLTNLKKRAEELGIGDKVFFTGTVENQDLKNYFACSDLAVHANLCETQGLVYYESLAAGLPVVCFYNESVKDLVTDGYNGYKVVSEKDMGEKIKYLMENKDVLDKLKSNTIKSVEEYDAKDFGKKVLAYYEDILNKKI